MTSICEKRYHLTGSMLTCVIVMEDEFLLQFLSFFSDVCEHFNSCPLFSDVYEHFNSCIFSVMCINKVFRISELSNNTY